MEGLASLEKETDAHYSERHRTLPPQASRVMLPSPSLKLLPGPLCWGRRCPAWVICNPPHLAMLRTHIQVLVAVTLLLTQHWDRWCTDPLTLNLPKTPSHTQTSGRKGLFHFCLQELDIKVSWFFFLNNALNFILIDYTILLSDSTNQSVKIQFCGDRWSVGFP